MSINRQEIIDEYNTLCSLANKRLTRTEYRNYDTKYSSTTIESIWGSWSDFVEEADAEILINRYNSVKVFKKNVNKIVITSVNDGSEINEKFFNTLLNYCSYNKAEFGILWGKSLKRNKTFDAETFALLQPYLATRFEFKRDKDCIAQDFLIPSTQKNPLLNLDKLSTDIKTIIVGSNKQYLQVLPYKQYNAYRIACSTGTLSLPQYKDTVAGHIDSKYHKFGAILLEWNEEYNRYVIRNLIYNHDKLYDLNVCYSENNVEKEDNIPAMILGDLHLPDQDDIALDKTEKMIDKLSPEYVMLHDVASWNSVCHHNFGKCLFNAQNLNDSNSTLEKEFRVVRDTLNSFTNRHEDVKFRIVNSNHDNFIEKWLDTGEFVKDKQNAIIGAKLFIKYCNGQNIFDNCLNDNIEFLPKNESFNICGVELSEHGDGGVSGALGGPNAYNKTFESSVVGHTHSCMIREKTIYVGTLSELIVNYNQKGMTTWIHANAIVHKNGEVQLILI